MRNLFFLLLTISFTSFSQDDNPLDDFDFWVGEWNAIWYGPDSVRIFGSNSITKTLDGNVIQENFEDPNNNFLGTSISVYSLADSTWHQAWADNTGGYINLIGSRDGEKRILTTIPVDKGNQTIVYRMVFYNIKDNKFTWDWEKSTDGGATWNLSWRIHYTRIV